MSDLIERQAWKHRFVVAFITLMQVGKQHVFSTWRSGRSMSGPQYGDNIFAIGAVAVLWRKCHKPIRHVGTTYERGG